MCDTDYLLPDHWIRDHDLSLWRVMYDSYVGRVVQLVLDCGAKTVIEVGCGDGWNCGQLANAGVQVVGVDRSKNGIEHARRLVTSGKFYQGDITDPSFSDEISGPFDACIFVEVIEHIPPAECVSALRNITQLLKPGGALILTTPSVNVPNLNPQHYRHFSEHDLRKLIDEAGSLEIKSVEGYGDVSAARRYHRVARFLNNRYYTIYPWLKYLNKKYRNRCVGTSAENCEGFIIAMRRSG